MESEFCRTRKINDRLQVRFIKKIRFNGLNNPEAFKEIVRQTRNMFEVWTPIFYDALIFIFSVFDDLCMDDNVHFAIFRIFISFCSFGMFVISAIRGIYLLEQFLCLFLIGYLIPQFFCAFKDYIYYDFENRKMRKLLDVFAGVIMSIFMVVMFKIFFLEEMNNLASNNSQ